LGCGWGCWACSPHTHTHTHTERERVRERERGRERERERERERARARERESSWHGMREDTRTACCTHGTVLHYIMMCAFSSCFWFRLS
jgi:hypothetical protein